MAISRYNYRNITVNNAAAYVYSDIFRKRNKRVITQYATTKLTLPSPQEMPNLQLTKRIWTAGTKYYNLAHEYYGDPEYWWVIAQFNLKPLETDFNPGDVVIIPGPLNSVLSYYGVSGL